ncbi:hypothetical protein F5Y17DRAFT_430206 [Xylariaceae sp. FL0594]|nr:hypothetical protein F5Y17DRAFT_430206 [Xylariaceae sp. FL0594]
MSMDTALSASEGQTKAPETEPVSQLPVRKAVVSVILEMPYEVILTIFKFLDSEKTIDAFACAHPYFESVRSQNNDSIARALIYTDAAEIARAYCNHADAYLAVLCVALSQCHRHLDHTAALTYLGSGPFGSLSTKQRSEKQAQDVLNDWVLDRQGDRSTRCPSPREIIRRVHYAAGHLDFLGCFEYNGGNPLLLPSEPSSTASGNREIDSSGILSRWQHRPDMVMSLNKSFEGMTGLLYVKELLGTDGLLLLVKSPQTREYLEALLIAELWCYCWRLVPDGEERLSREQFLGLFSEQSAARAEAMSPLSDSLR